MGLGGSCRDVRGQFYSIRDRKDFCQHKCIQAASF